MDYKRKREENISDESNKKRVDTGVLLRSDLTQKCSLNTIYDGWKSTKEVDIKNSNLQVLSNPFKHCVVQEFIRDTQFLEELKKELYVLDFVTKHNDLYQFQQSLDLFTQNTPFINSFKEFLAGDCRQWLQEVTGIQLNHCVSVTCSCYNYTDHLLCHDDKCEDRRIAFILYMSDSWQPSYGGDLQLFNTDENHQPKEVVHSIWPEFNSFVFFEVTNNSYHQVAEILTADRTRLSLNGWFHGEPVIHNTHFLEPPLQRINPVPGQVLEGDLLQWVNPMYLNRNVQLQIAEDFENNSEILLPDFLHEDMYSHVCKSLCEEQLSWKERGPANRRKYEVCAEFADQLAALLNVFKSEVMFHLLSKLTNLDLTYSEAGSSSKSPGKSQCHYEVQRWQRGSYTLIHDDDKTFSEPGLDVNLFFNTDQVCQRQGGFISYIARDADEELLTVWPCENSLALTFRDKDTLRFVKYLNNCLSKKYHAISFCYYE